MSQLEFDGVASEQAAEAGMSEAYWAARVRLWKLSADGWLHSCDSGTEFTADDLVADVGLPDKGANRNNVVGAWVASKSKQGHIRFAGRLRKSKRVARHVGLQRVWVKV